MSKPMKIGGYLIVQLEGQLSPLDAFRELVDNAIDARATKIEISLTKKTMTIVDNGDGTDDPNVIATPSMSHSRHNKRAIGSKAIGAKQALATFGRTWHIQTVAKGTNQYRSYKLHWDENGPLPDQFDGPISPARDAPQEIRTHGTKIIVTDRQAGFPNIRLDPICRTLEDTYRPALDSGKLKIIVRNPEDGYARQLKNEARDMKLFAEPVQQENGRAAGRSFVVCYGSLKETHRVLTGCHFIFGPRVIETTDSIGSLALPSQCYVDVTLGTDWKSLLSTNKTKIARYTDELIHELETILTEWVARQKEQAAAYKMELISGAVAALMNESLAILDKKQTGEFRNKPREIRDGPLPPRPVPGPPNPDPTTRRPRALFGGDYGVIRERTQGTAILKIEPDKTMGRKLFRTQYLSETNEIVVFLNHGPYQREVKEYFDRGKIDDLYKIAVLAFAHHVSINKSRFARVFSQLRERGYDIDETDNDSDIVSKISNFLVDALYGRKGSIKRAAAAA
jgi:hypothetical protein